MSTSVAWGDPQNNGVSGDWSVVTGVPTSPPQTQTYPIGPVPPGCGTTTKAKITLDGVDIDAPTAVCRFRGHRLDPAVVTYADGVIISRCVDCDERFEIPWFAGGTAALRLRGLVTAILGMDDPEEETVGKFIEAAGQLDADMAAMEDALELAKECKRVIARRLRED